MPAEPSSTLLQALSRTIEGDREAASRILPAVYEELRKLAKDRLAALPPGLTLQPTVLVHEAYLRLVGDGDPGWEGRRHFFGAAARAMRDVVVDHARARAAAKRGGGRRPTSLDHHEPAALDPDLELIELHELIKRLEADDPRKGQIVNLRFFAGMSVNEAAEILGVSVGTIEREWRYIRSWLYTRLRSDDHSASEGGAAR